MLELLYFAADMVIGDRYLNFMWLLLAIVLWYLVGFSTMVLVVLGLMATLMICAAILIFGFSYLASKRID